MHDGQLTVTVDTVRALLAEQAPELAAERIEALNASGTVNSIFRIGDRLAARFPLVLEDPDAAAHRLEAEAGAAEELKSITTVPTPVVVAIGRSGHGYPGPWSIVTWLDGTPATPRGLADSVPFADDVAAFIAELRDAPVAGRAFSGPGRGGDLQAHDDWVRSCLTHSVGLLDVDALDAAWVRLRELPRVSDDVMSHTDLIPANLLVRDGRLAGVLDVGGFAPADPALDLVVAWHMFEDAARQVLRRRLEADDLEWARGAAWAFEQALGLVWYYRESNPAMSELGRSTLERVMASGVTSL